MGSQNDNINYLNKNDSIKKFENFHLLNKLTKNSYNFYSYLDNSFCIFKSINNIFYLIYCNIDGYIIAYDIIDNKIIIEIKIANKEHISCFKHYLDKINERDLIISITDYDSSIKIWNVNNWEIIFNIKHIYEKGCMDSACFLNDNNNIYILTSCCLNLEKEYELIKVFDLNGNKIKEINDSNFEVKFIDVYYDIKLSRNYIITGNVGYIRSYDYNHNLLYKRYCDNKNNDHYSLVINDKDRIIKLPYIYSI